MMGIIVGTRPEIIKMSPVIRECLRRKIKFILIHSGQHYSSNMDAIFFEDLKLPKPDYNLNVGSSSHAKQTGDIMRKLENILIKRKVKTILVQGDTNTVLASSLVAVKLGIKIGHIEAGLRSFDKAMPEEINRIISDNCSDLLFAPTKTGKTNLLKCGIDKEKIFVVGNTIVDAIIQNLKIARKRNTLKKLGLNKEEYVLLTIHRPENTDNPKKLKRIFESVKEILKITKLKIIFPIHPRTKKICEKSNLEHYLKLNNLKVIEPLGYLDFLNLEEGAKVILTDSGGIQEEACILNIPCVTLRENTERPETLTVGCNTLVGTNTKKILLAFKKMEKIKRGWKNPFGDGTTSKKILDAI